MAKILKRKMETNALHGMSHDSMGTPRLGDTSLRSRAVSELIRHEGAARGSCQLRHSDASKRGISDLFLSECPSLVAAPLMIHTCP